MSVLLKNNGLFIFHGDSYLYHDLAVRKIDDQSKSLQTSFNIPFSMIDAVLRWDDEIVFFFKGMDCLKYDLTKNSVIPGYPKKILFEWKGIWLSDFSDAIKIGDKVFFFRKTQYISYDVKLGKADTGYPKLIADGWHGVWESVDGAEYLGKDKVFFLKGDQVIQYDLKRRRADSGYPLNLDDYVKSYSYSNNS